MVEPHKKAKTLTFENFMFSLEKCLRLKIYLGIIHHYVPEATRAFYRERNKKNRATMKND